tara:strand:+ start:1105 stop:1740 length:636 start_codon:yes stop_codon:yes gene_type:complete
MVFTSRKMKHPELWAYNLNPEKWEQEFVHPQTRFMDWDAIIKEEGTDIYTWPLFTKKFCRMLIEEAEFQNVWTVARHDNYPTTDFMLSEIGLHDMYDKILKRFAFPIARHIWGLEGKEWGDEMTHETFLAKYSPDAQGSLSSHIDSSNYSITLALNNDFTGGGTWYNRQKTLVKAPVGHVCLFPMPTHRHSGRWIDSGKRYIVVSFCKKGW